MEDIDKIDIEMLEAIERFSPITLSELVRALGLSKSSVWRRIRKLSSQGFVEIRKQGGTLLILKGIRDLPVRVLRLGILRASEYPYILYFQKALKDIYEEVKIIVYDEAFKLALDLASGRIHLGMAPVPSLLLAHRASLGRVKIIGGGSGGGSGIAVGGSGQGHATTMASTMELCAEHTNLEGPRIYMRRGEKLLEALKKGIVKKAVLWEPYLTLAKEEGFNVVECDLPFCCVLGGHVSIGDKFDKIKELFALSISHLRTLGFDSYSYSDLVSLPRPLIEKTVRSYTFMEETPINEIKKLWNEMSRAILPKELTLKEAFV